MRATQVHNERIYISGLSTALDGEREVKCVLMTTELYGLHIVIHLQ